MSFVNAMNDSAMNNSKIKTGVNSALVYTEDGIGDKRVALFTMLNRGLDREYLQQSVRDIFHKTLEYQRDLFQMAFYTRDIRGGKGEKKIFYNFIEVLYELAPDVTCDMMQHVPEYGCWRDMWELMYIIPALSESILKVVKNTFFSDRLYFSTEKKEKMSLLSKWLPREGSKTYKGLAQKIAAALYSTLASQREQIIMYRKEVAAMNRALQTTEIAMCSKSWAQIKPEAVPGRCLKIHTNAFFNQSCKKSSTELRYPDSADRMECREHFIEHNKGLQSGIKKVNGANVIFPHELVMKGLDSYTTMEEHIINQAQWESIRIDIQKGGGLGKAVAMCDFSGSMSGLPKLISLSLGILISEVTHPAFRDHILSFDSTPRWHSFASCTTLKEKLKSISPNLGKGLNTDFHKACLTILDRMIEYKVPIGEEPEDLIVLTDMGFDEATYHHSSDTEVFMLQNIRDLFKVVGQRVWDKKEGWQPPRIIIWNLRSEYNDFHATAHQEGIVQLSGWSPSALKAIQKGRIQVQSPYQGMCALIHDTRYLPILRSWQSSINQELKE